MSKIILDLEELLKRIDNDKELLKKIFHYLIDEFIDEYNNRRKNKCIVIVLY